MSEVTTPAPTTPATSAPLPVTHNQILEKLIAKADYDGNVPTPAAPAPEPKKVDVKLDPKIQTRIATLEKEKRDADAKIKELETKTSSLTTFEEAQALLTSGKKLEAFAKLTGKDPAEEMETLLSSYLEQPNEGNEANLAAKVDEINKRLDAEKTARESADKARQDAEESARFNNVLQFAYQTLDQAVAGDPSSFELCSHPDNRSDAATLAIGHAGDLAVARGIDPKELTPDTTATLLRDAFRDVEAELEAEGQERAKELARFTKKQTPQKSPLKQLVGPPAVRAETVQQTPQIRPQLPKPSVSTITNKGKLTSHESILERLKEKARYN